MPERQETAGRRAVWSGSLTFGLVSFTVALWPTVRRTRAGLRLLGPSGKPLKQRYVSGETGRFLDNDDVVKALPHPEGGYTPVTTEELAELRPAPTSEIELDSFVKEDQLDPLLVDASYLLLPAGSEATDAYFLLAAALEREQRAGLAAFTLHGRVRQLVVSAAGPCLQAFTLRAPSTLRTPAELGVTPPADIDPAARDRFTAALLSLEENRFDPRLTVSSESRRLTELVLRKLQQKQDLVEPLPEEDGSDVSDGEAVFPDLAEQLRQSLGTSVEY